MEKENWREKIVYFAGFLFLLHFTVSMFAILYQKAVNPNLFNIISSPFHMILTITFLLFFRKPLKRAVINSFFFYSLIILLFSFLKNFQYMIKFSELGTLESWTGILLPLFAFFALLYYLTNGKKKIIKTRHHNIEGFELFHALNQFNKK